MNEKDIMTAIAERNSVRNYNDERIPDDIRKDLNDLIDECNREGNLHIQMENDAPGVFDGFLARNFSGVSDYIALIGKKSDDLDLKIGYYGEKIVLRAQQLGLNTCWVALTYSKKKMKCTIGPDEKVVCVLALGYGTTQGTRHTSKPAEELGVCDEEWPEWFKKGIEASMLAPTAMNKQKFRFTLLDGKVKAESLGGSYSEVNLGIVKLHFELGAGKDNFQWA